MEKIVHIKSGVWLIQTEWDIGGISVNSESGNLVVVIFKQGFYSALTNNTNSTMQCDSLICKAVNGNHNYNNFCDF